MLVVNYKKIISLLALSLLSFFVSASAQEESKNVPELFKPYGQQVPRENKDEQRMQLIRRLMQQRDYDNAASILELALEQSPENPTVQNLLLSCYISLNYHLKAELMARRLIARHPNSVGFKLELARQLTLQDKGTEAVELYRELVDSVKQDNQAGLDIILNNMIRNDQVEMALGVIESKRREWGDNHLFASRLGAILEKKGLWVEAAQEYYSILERDSSRNASQAEKRLIVLLKFIDSAPVVEAELNRIVKSGDNARVLRLLIAHYIAQHEFDSAFDLTLRSDSIDRAQLAKRANEPDSVVTREKRESIQNVVLRKIIRDGKLTMANIQQPKRPSQNILLQFINNCADQGEYAQVLRMCEFIRGSPPDSTSLKEIAVHYAQALAETDRLEEAIAAYGEAADRFNDLAGRSDMLFRIGQIYSERLQDFDQALVYFDSIVNHYKSGQGYIQAMGAIPITYFRQGKFVEAKLAFKALPPNLMTIEAVERASFYLALVAMTQKEYDSTSVGLQRMILNHPRGFYVNDAVSLLSILTRAESAEQLRDQMAEAIISQYRRKPDLARQELLKVATNTDQTLADLALYRLLTLELSLADSSAALAFAERLIDGFDQSYYYPLALKTKADIFLTREGGEVEAREIYLELLGEYPTYPFASEVRKVLRELDQTDAAGLQETS